MQRLGYRISMGGLSLSHDARASDGELVSLRCTRGIDLFAGECSLEVFMPRGRACPAVGDPVTVGLDGGDGMTTVFTGAVQAVSQTPLGIRLDAVDSLSRLARLDLAAAYEEKSVGDIVQDILGQAGLDAGRIDDGPTFAHYVLHGGPRALAHLRALAARWGRHIFTDGDGRVHFVAMPRGAAEHTFKIGEDVLHFDLAASPLPFDSVIVWGESAGDDEAKAHWLADDLDNVRGQAAIAADGSVERGSSGKSPLVVRDGAVRTGEAARELAAAICGAAARLVTGFLDVPGRPAVDVGSLVAVDGLALPSASLPVRRIDHRLSAAHGFITRVEF